MMRFIWLILCILGVASGTRADDLEQRLDSAAKRLPEFKQRIEKLRSAGQDVSYPMVTYTVLENFIPLMSSDLTVAVPNGWGWSGINGAISTMTPVKDAHSGQWAVKIVHKTDFAPNVYGLGENSIAAKTSA